MTDETLTTVLLLSDEVTQVNRESLGARAQLGTTLCPERKSRSRRSRAQCPSLCCQSTKVERERERERERGNVDRQREKEKKERK